MTAFGLGMAAPGGGNVLLGELVCRADHVTVTEDQGVRPNDGLTQQDGRRNYSARCPPRQACMPPSLQAGSPASNPEEEEWGQRGSGTFPTATPEPANLRVAEMRSSKCLTSR